MFFTCLRELKGANTVIYKKANILEQLQYHHTSLHTCQQNFKIFVSHRLINRGVTEIQQQPGIKAIPNITDFMHGKNVGLVDF